MVYTATTMEIQNTLMFFGIYLVFLQAISVNGVDDECKDGNKQCSQPISLDHTLCSTEYFKVNCRKTCGLCRGVTKPSSGSVDGNAVTTKGYENYSTGVIKPSSGSVDGNAVTTKGYENYSTGVIKSASGSVSGYAVTTKGYEKYTTEAIKPLSGSGNGYAVTTKGYENYTTAPLSDYSGAVLNKNKLSYLVTDNRVTSTLCPCSCEYKTKLDYWGGLTPVDRDKLVKEILQRLHYMTQALKVNKTKLSSFWRRHQSTEDHRKSTQSIGLSGQSLLLYFWRLLFPWIFSHVIATKWPCLKS